MLDTLESIYRRTFTDENVERIDHATLLAATIGFAIHLALIGLAHVWPNAPYFVQVMDGSFLSAIYTPFSFILFYEVFALVLSIPRSFTSSVGVQLQIISLIVIRRIFGDIGHLDHVKTLTLESQWVHWLAYDMLAALGMFFGVIAFSRVSQRVPDAQEFQDIESFVRLKRSITFCLAILLIVLAVVTLGTYLFDALTAISQGEEVANINENKIFYKDMFTVMVFADVAVLLASLVYSHKFELVFRNAGFVVATVLIRLSLSIPRPLDLLFIAAAFVFAIGILFGYGYYLEIEAREAVEEDEEPDIV
jgi:hypothetical protein